MSELTSYFTKLKQYDLWANDRYIAVVEEHNVANEKVLWQLSHILQGQIAWYNRVSGNSFPPDFKWGAIYDIGYIKAELAKYHLLHIQLIESTSLETVLNYKTLDGTPVESNYSDILAHLINHGTYHRAQAAVRLKEDGIQPPSTDYIVYSRTALTV